MLTGGQSETCAVRRVTTTNEPPGVPQRRFTRHIRELPEPSTAWRGAGAALIGIAVGTAIFAATLSEDAPISKAALAWIAAGLCLALAILCFLSHWDSNRGRRGKVVEIVDESS
jgi:predicted MFS family arabinose efflux permease